MEINKNGGVMGRQLSIVEADTAGDPVDAIPAFRKLMADHPVVMFGPTSHEISSTANLSEAAKVPSFFIGGSVVYDKSTLKYVWRTLPSDTEETAAMAYYALEHGYKRMSFLFGSDADTQAQLQYLVTSYTAHGGTVVDKESLALNQTSYRTEAAKAFAGKPDAVFVEVDPKAVQTLFSNIRELGHLNVPFVAGSSGYAPEWATGMGGFAVANKYLVALNTTAAIGPAFTHFVDVLKAYDGKAPDPISNYVYDDVVIASLAMTIAKTTDPTVWVNDVAGITGNESGTECTDYADCISLIKSGQSIDFEGAGGNDDFNKYHNVFGDFAALQFKPDGTIGPLESIPAATVSQFEG
jgi:ABC-type branched-subunit amino acid transport system substrate-binding protein